MDIDSKNIWSTQGNKPEPPPQIQDKNRRYLVYINSGGIEEFHLATFDIDSHTWKSVNVVPPANFNDSILMWWELPYSTLSHK
jgi:hypothetical protein